MAYFLKILTDSGINYPQNSFITTTTGIILKMFLLQFLPLMVYFLKILTDSGINYNKEVL